MRSDDWVICSIENSETASSHAYARDLRDVAPSENIDTFNHPELSDLSAGTHLISSSKVHSQFTLALHSQISSSAWKCRVRAEISLSWYAHALDNSGASSK
jgi:hypothetical protein